MTDSGSDKINVVIAMNFSDEILEELRDISPALNIKRYHPDVPAAVWSDAEVLYTGSTFPRPEEAPLLRWIQLNSAGLDRALEQKIVQAEDIIVTNASGIHVKQMANYTLMMILAFHYNLPQMIHDKANIEWAPNRFEVYNPDELQYKTLGIVGYGSIGREIARVVNFFGMRTLASKRNIKHPAESSHVYTVEGTGDPGADIPERLYPSEALMAMASECDYLVLTTPLTDETRHMVNEKVLNAMKPSSVLINVGRGELVDEKALITALSSGKIRGAALDVFEEEPLPKTSPLWNLDNVIISPHISGNSVRYAEHAARLFAENLRRYIDKRPLLNALNRDEGY